MIERALRRLHCRLVGHNDYQVTPHSITGAFPMVECRRCGRIGWIANLPEG